MLTRGTTIWKHATLYSSPHLLILTPPSTHLKGNTQTKTKINTKTKWKYSTEYATPYFSSSTSNYSESIFKLNQSSNVLKSFPTIQTYQRKCEYQRSGSLHCWNAPLTSGEFFLLLRWLYAPTTAFLTFFNIFDNFSRQRFNSKDMKKPLLVPNYSDHKLQSWHPKEVF